MARLLAAEDLDVHPDYHMFGIGETTAGFGESPPVPGSGWLGVGQASVLVGVVDYEVSVTKRQPGNYLVRLWPITS